MEDSKATEESIILSNKSAVENLRKEKYDHAIFFLNQALLATKGMKDGTTKSNLLAMTYNNLGCYLKRLNKQSQALEYFNKSSELSKRFEINIANITCSHLNISKIHSEQGNHELALRHALKSLFLLRHNFANKNTLVSSLIIAYQTVGIEYKFLNQNPDSFECFETGLNLSMRHLGRNHEVTLALKKSLHELEGKSSRSQSNSSKKRDHVRGRSAGIQKIPSKLLEPKPAPYEQKTFQVEARPKVKTKEKILRRIGRAEIKAAVKLQRWWKKIVIKIRFNRKKLAAVKIQRWWRKIMGKKKAKVNFHRPRSVKRHVIKKNRAQGPSAPETKALISAKEKKYVADTNKFLKTLRSAEPEVKALNVFPEKKPENVKTSQGLKEFNQLESTYPKIDSTSIKNNPEKLEDLKKREVSKVRESTPKSSENHEIKTKVEIKTSQTTPADPRAEVVVKPISHHSIDTKSSLNPTASLPENSKERLATESSIKSTSQKGHSKRNFLENRRADISHQINSLIKIQSFVRMVPIRLNFMKQKKSCLKIQSFYRGLRIKRLFQAIRDAVIFIQYMYRKYRSRIMYKN